MYGLLLVLMIVPKAAKSGSPSMILCMFAIVLAGCVEKVSTICLAVAVEREWPSVISSGSASKLTLINTWLRRTVGALAFSLLHS